MPFMGDEETDGDMTIPLQPVLQPLQDLPPNITSPRKRSQDAKDQTRKDRPSVSPGKERTTNCAQLHIDETIIVEKENTEDIASVEMPPPVFDDETAAFSAGIEAPRNLEEPPNPAQDDASPLPLTEGDKRKVQTNQAEQLSEIRALLAARQQPADDVVSNLPPRRRKDRKLGRAASSSSAGSLTVPHPPPPPLEIADSNMSASPITTQTEVFARPSVPGSRSGSGPGPGVGIGGGGLDMEAPPMPSQQLSYEAPDAEEHRRRMSAKMGLRLEDETRGQRVGSVGQLKDVELGGGGGGGGVGGRVRGRQRGARNP